ncbi:Peptide methionine sulfoxide reductase [Podospora pseudocomata]|uniref:peptide-methionine (S)-S-oxide reductase n=1 Tax=Podospora pseudocomata TaxID=2093779 RepID=A0ABR0GRS3_9PEZI|nr:Peptide methionine sulfoxide reductase [Podospora pseudocomata]
MSTCPFILTKLFAPFSRAAIAKSPNTHSLLKKMGTSASASAATQKEYPEGAARATVAAGCFWGVEHMYRKHFGSKGLYDARVGYIGGNTQDPSYRAVCSGNTGHAEATLLVYDPTKISYTDLLTFFYRMHDPTTSNQQGPDRGSQYRSGIFYHDAEQEKTAREMTKKANEQWWNNKIVTEILPAQKWWDAEDYHQEYLTKNPYGYECPSHFLRNFPDLQ